LQASGNRSTKDNDDKKYNKEKKLKIKKNKIRMENKKGEKIL
jgi:hypothetical protein